MAVFKSLSHDEIMHHPGFAIEAEQTVQAQNNQQYKISGQLLLDFQRHLILGHVENSYSQARQMYAGLSYDPVVDDVSFR